MDKISQFNELIERTTAICGEVDILGLTVPKKPRQKQSRGRRSKQKGKRGEQESAQFFGELFFNDSRAYIKSPGSGSYVFHGDIANNPEKKYDYTKFPLCVEVKNDERFDLGEFLSKSGKFDNTFIAKTIRQCLKDAAKSNELPIIYMTKNYKKALIILPLERCVFDPFNQLSSFHLLFWYQNINWLAMIADEFAVQYKSGELFITWKLI